VAARRSAAGATTLDYGLLRAARLVAGLGLYSLRVAEMAFGGIGKQKRPPCETRQRRVGLVWCGTFGAPDCEQCAAEAGRRPVVTVPIPSTSTASTLRSRRALLAGAIGGLGAWAASAVGRATPARAGVDGDVVLGGANVSSGTTSIENLTNTANTMFFVSTMVGGAVAGSSSLSDAIIGFSRDRHGVVGASTSGHGVHGSSDTGWAGYFDGRVFTNRFVELAEIANPSAPGSNRARLFIRDRDGKTQLCVRFHNGTIRVVASA